MSFKKLEYVISNIKNSDEYKTVFEKRPKRYMFGCKNYGAIPDIMNRADLDPWDCFAPGYEFRELKIGKKYKIKELLGYYRLENKNHKIAIQVYVPGFDEIKAKKEIKYYCDKYTEKVGVEGECVCLKTGYEL